MEIMIYVKFRKYCAKESIDGEQYEEYCTMEIMGNTKEIPMDKLDIWRPREHGHED